MAIVRLSISDPDCEIENLRHFTVHSTHLKGRADITVFVPPNTQDLSNLPMVMLLHGVYSSHWAWTRQMNVHNIVLDHIEKGLLSAMVLVMPSDGLWGDGSAYLPHSGFNFENWITEDVIEAVILEIPQVGKSSKKFISGLSMGGYGALRIGSKYSHIFNGFSGHSSITGLDQMPLFVMDEISIFNPEHKDKSVLNSLQNNKHELSPFRFDCGIDDLLIEHNRTLHKQLNQLKIPHIYEEYTGSHTASYWQEHIMTSLRFFAKLME